MSARRALIVVDMQCDFLTGALPAEGGTQILPRVAERVRRARAAGDEVLFTVDSHGADYLQTREGREIPVPHCIEGTPGRQIDPSLGAEGAKVFEKSAFGSVALGEYARAQGFDDIELVGVCTDICVISNAVLLRSFCPEAHIAVRADCCAGVTSARHETALQALAACGVEIL